jgi:hypothetical protein
MKTTTASGKPKIRKHRAHWINGQLICSCGSRKFTILREPVARKVHTRESHRKRCVALCKNGRKTRIGFPS